MIQLPPLVICCVQLEAMHEIRFNAPDRYEHARFLFVWVIVDSRGQQAARDPSLSICMDSIAFAS